MIQHHGVDSRIVQKLQSIPPPHSVFATITLIVPSWHICWERDFWLNRGVLFWGIFGGCMFGVEPNFCRGASEVWIRWVTLQASCNWKETGSVHVDEPRRELRQNCRALRCCRACQIMYDRDCLRARVLSHSMADRFQQIFNKQVVEYTLITDFDGSRWLVANRFGVL